MGGDGICEDRLQLDRTAVESCVSPDSSRDSSLSSARTRERSSAGFSRVLEQAPLLVGQRTGASLQQHPDVASDER